MRLSFFLASFAIATRAIKLNTNSLDELSFAAMTDLILDVGTNSMIGVQK